jgi:hypothetical protein
MRTFRHKGQEEVKEDRIMKNSINCRPPCTITGIKKSSIRWAEHVKRMRDKICIYCMYIHTYTHNFVGKRKMSLYLTTRFIPCT